MHKDQSYQYSLLDIEKYLKGELSPAAMHALEKTALTDPFLADAIEGYQQANLQTGHQHLSEIRNMVLQGDEKGRIVPFVQPAIKWFSIAAILLLVAGMATVGWLWLKPNKTSAPILVKQERKDSVHPPYTPVQQTNIATNSKQNKADRSLEKATVPSIVTEKDTSLSMALADNKQLRATPVVPQLLPGYSARISATDSFAELKSLQKSIATLDQTNNVTPMLQGKAAGVLVKNRREPFMLQGKVLDIDNKPLRNASVTFHTGPARKTVSTDTAGSFQVGSKDSAVTVIVSALGYQSATSTLTSATANLVTLNTQSSTLDEVVVTGYSKERKKQLLGAVTLTEPIVKDSLPILPIGGMAEWIRSVQLKWAAEKGDNDALKGNISCILTLDTTGRVINVVFTGVNNRRVKKRLTRFLKEGPLWLKQGQAVKGNYQVLLSF